MRFRPANIRLINRRHYLPRLLLPLSSFKRNDQRTLTGHSISGKSSLCAASATAVPKRESGKLETFSGFPAVLRIPGKNHHGPQWLSAITPNSSRFEQAFSEDAGKTWETNWIMTFNR